MNTYKVIDNQTGKVMGTYSSRKAASRKADKLDLAYGAIRYSVQIADLTPFQADVQNMVIYNRRIN